MRTSILLFWRRAPYAWPNRIGTGFYALVLGAWLLVSVGLVAYAVLRLRAEAAKGTAARAKRASSWLSGARAWLDARRRSPSLDDDPVLWREWRRGRPSRLARIVWGCYFALASVATAWGVLIACTSGDADAIGLLSGFQATLGLLLVSIIAPTALAEERCAAASRCS